MTATPFLYPYIPIAAGDYSDVRKFLSHDAQNKKLISLKNCGSKCKISSLVR